MSYPNNITSMHLELSDRCQASCPMCPRNAFGGAEREHITNTDISIDNFKQWFPPSFLNKMRHVFACGNNGDPLMAKDCFEIFKYLASNTTDNCQLDIHTNGSLRSSEWWKQLGQELGKRVRVIFAIDGLADTHSIYRRGTDWHKIINNAKILIENGGLARADSLVFSHNEHQTGELEQYLLGMGFDSVNFKPTFRFYGLDKFPVKNRKGQFEYYIQPAQGPRWNHNLPQPNFVKLIPKENFQAMLDSAEIDPACWKGQIYLNCQGHVYPCCWVSSSIDNSRYVEIQSQEEEILRDRLSQSSYDIVKDIGMIDLNGTNIETAIANSKWNSNLPKHFTTDPKLVCVKSCATNFSKIIR